MDITEKNDFSSLKGLNLAVVGHVEWVTFLKVDKLPKAGIISHSLHSLEEPAGGGALAAFQMRSLTKSKVHFFTALGKDDAGEKSYERLKNLGLELHIAWRNEPTRKGISFVDSDGERAITVVGKRLEPRSTDDLPWKELSNFDGVFITATDSQSIKFCRKAKVLTATPRLGVENLKESNIQIDVLIGSGLDPDEQIDLKELSIKPKTIIYTEGKLGGRILPGGRYTAIKSKEPLIDSYGCGDSFAAAVTTGLAANWSLNEAISIGAYCGAKCSSYFGPYPEPD
tara:strand:- start:3400 stop:4251 length:852 start_codon:yes stop_codon:yes gene_type:complete